MKDNFSAQASAYAKFRPDYPDEMIRFIVSQATNRHVALDVATGNGQVAVKLAAYFDEIIGTDISEKQLDMAVKWSDVTYKIESAEKTDFAGQSLDLITVAQAIHWFRFDEFYDEVRRILKPDGLLAVMGYGLFSTNPDSDAILLDFYHNIVGPYWDPERRYLDEMYRTIPFPFLEIPAPTFENRFSWSYEQLTGYLESWSAVQHYKDKNGSDPVGLIADELKSSWGHADKMVTFPMLLRLGKLP